MAPSIEGRFVVGAHRHSLKGVSPRSRTACRRSVFRAPTGASGPRSGVERITLQPCGGLGGAVSSEDEQGCSGYVEALGHPKYSVR